MKFQFDAVKHTTGTIALALVMPLFFMQGAAFWPKPWIPTSAVVVLLVVGWACGMLSRELLVKDVEDVVQKKPPTVPPLAVLMLCALAVILPGCSAALTQQALDTANAVAQCVAPIVLDVTGQATEDPLQIAAACGVAVQDVYNFVVAEINAAKGGQTTDGGVALRVSPTTGRYFTLAQVGKLERIRDNAAKILGKKVGQP